MRTILLAALFAVLMTGAAQAQSLDVEYIPMNRDIYEARFTASGATGEVCFHDVADTTGDGVMDSAVDVDGDGDVSKADAITCTTAVVPDGSTTNSHFIDLDAGRRGTDHKLAAIAYRHETAGTLMSGLSNIATLLIRPEPVLLLSGEFGETGDLNG